MAVSVVEAVFPPWLTPMVVVPVVLVVANPAFTGALAIVATLEMVELQCELMLTSCVVLSLKVPSATNCCVLPCATVGFAGVMSTDTSVPVPIVTDVDPVTPKADAVTVRVQAFFACKIPLRRMFARLFFEERHDTFVSVAVLPSLYVPTAVNFSEVPFCTRPFAGEIAIETSVTLETVSVVELLTDPSIAVIVVLPVERLDTNPRLVIVATVGVAELHRTDSVISCVELSLKVPVALNCLVASSGIEEFAGAIDSETRVAVVTVTEVLAETVPDVTLTVEVPGPTASARPF